MQIIPDNFKPIPGFSTFFISSDGKVMNSRGRILSDWDCNGYRRISIKNDIGKRIGSDIHRLVASAWLGPIPKGMWVNHEDGDKANNRIENLKIDTPSYNQKHRFDVLGHRSSNLNLELQEAIQILHNLNWSQHKISKALRCSQPAISQILSRIKLEQDKAHTTLQSPPA